MSFSVVVVIVVVVVESLLPFSLSFSLPCYLFYLLRHVAASVEEQGALSVGGLLRGHGRSRDELPQAGEEDSLRVRCHRKKKTLLLPSCFTLQRSVLDVSHRFGSCRVDEAQALMGSPWREQRAREEAG